MNVIQHSKRFNVLACGRRWGKTILGMDRIINVALEGKPCAWFSPTYKLLSDPWRELRSTLAPVTRDRSEQEKRIELINGGVIELWSLDSVDSGRGRKYALVVIDEAAMIPGLEEAWQESIRPTLTDLIGSAWFLSTPKGQNYFKTLFDLGQDPERDDWASWQMATRANAYIDPQEIEAARQDMTEAAFNQEYLALFLNWEGSVFRRVAEAATAAPKTKPEAGHEYVFGVDWGRSNDYTVFVVLDVTTQTTVALDRSNRVDYSVQRDRLRALYELWRPKQILTEQNSIGQPIIEQLLRDKLPIQPFNTTNASKAQAIEALALAFERGDIRILNDSTLLGELVAYQAEPLPSGQMRYSAPNGQHDDCVMALAIAWSGVLAQQRVIYPIRESELIVRPFDIPTHWPQAYGLELGWDFAAAVWGAYDRASDVVYLISEYTGKHRQQMLHAAAIRSRGGWIPGTTDPLAKGRSQTEGDQLIGMYRELGLLLGPAELAIEPGVAKIWERMSTGRLKVFASLENYLQQLRVYHRDEGNQIIQQSDSLQNAARYLVASGISRMCTEPVKTALYMPRRYYGPDGWTAN